MPERRRLNESELAKAVAPLKGWALNKGTLHKEFLFPGFVEAFGFMTSVALIAEGLNHHPDWSNVYNRVVIDLSTHSEGGITGFDIEFARRVDALSPVA